jgi:preprotein translocase SecF subunit
MRVLPRLVPDDTRIPFLRFRVWALVGSVAVLLLSILLVAVEGLNFGIDFKGGILIEVRMPGERADLARMRQVLGGLGLGEVALQTAGADTDVMIRVQRQAGEEEAQQQAVETIKTALDTTFGEGIDYRRSEYVGPKVSAELLRNGVMAMAIALGLVLLYLWFRFEWQYGIGAIVCLIHDVAATIGLFSLTGLEFNLSTVAAILTIIGYSLNDTVVVFDRVRENLRRYRKMPLEELLDRSINDTLARTVMTGLTTVLALLALVIFGGEVIRSFTIAMIWGVIVGTYSTIYVGAPMLIYFNLRAIPEKAVAKTAS